MVAAAVTVGVDDAACIWATAMFFTRSLRASGVSFNRSPMLTPPILTLLRSAVEGASAAEVGPVACFEGALACIRDPAGCVEDVLACSRDPAGCVEGMLACTRDPAGCVEGVLACTGVHDAVAVDPTLSFTLACTPA